MLINKKKKKKKKTHTQKHKETLTEWPIRLPLSNSFLYTFASVTINLTKAEIAYNSSGSDLKKWLRNTLLLTFITTI